MPARPAESLPAEVYARVFENMPEGQQILEELIARFGGNPYVRGGHEADRETAFRAGRNEVVQYILRRINQAHGADPNDDAS
ncbi:hypothetical protein [Methylibium sp.]|uniref:Bbp19 family protein n=1 Tax=Methylibium sp. TaxID=2067992 RepID=UPI00333F4834